MVGIIAARKGKATTAVALAGEAKIVEMHASYASRVLARVVGPAVLFVVLGGLPASKPFFVSSLALPN